MLVLTRKQSEMICIGNDIVVKVIRTGKGTVKIGIEAPQSVRVLRAELTEVGLADTENAEDTSEVDSETSDDTTGSPALLAQRTSYLAVMNGTTA